jgi:hypothetical protein
MPRNRYTFSLAEKKKSKIVRGQLDFDNMVRRYFKILFIIKKIFIKNMRYINLY